VRPRLHPHSHATPRLFSVSPQARLLLTRVRPNTLVPVNTPNTPSSLYLPRCSLSRRLFSSSVPTMTATKIDGTAIARSIRERLGQEIKKKQETNPRYRPSLKIIQGMIASFVCGILC